MRYSDWYLSKNNKFSPSFIYWINEVENIVRTLTGFELLDLPDEPYMDYFLSGKSYDKTADEIVSNLYEL